MTKPEKLKLQSADVTRKNVEALAALFPHVVTEGQDEHGHYVHNVDFESLRQELRDHVDEGKEVYQIDWPGKLAAELASNAPIEKTLRPTVSESADFDTTKTISSAG